MGGDLARVDLRMRRRSTVAYAVGLALYTLVVVVLYPAFKDATSLDETINQSPGLAALFGVSGSITSPDGWMNANLYANFLPLIVLMLTIGYGAAALAGEEEAGRIDLVLALPLSRRAILLQKAAVLLVLDVVVVVPTVLAVFAGRAFEIDLAAGPVLTCTLGVVLLGAAFGVLALAIGGGTGQRGGAIGITAALAAAAYLLSSLAPQVPALKSWRPLSPFYWSVGNGQLSAGLGWDGLAVLVALCAAALVAAVIVFDRHDVRA
ncbi:MAG: ABC transporter permease subunit [Microthrixaceae bacterium]|nr:ABC transporter permease subunit [Microthrixaceae bacterium]